jgi:hypothetical protein
MKLIKDGKVAVIVSPGFGAGWSTWCSGRYPDADTNAELAQCILDGGDRHEVARRLFPHAFNGGLDSCVVEWVSQGEMYRIDEYDGSESLVVGHFDMRTA